MSSNKMSVLKQYILLLLLCFASSAWSDQLLVQPDMGRTPLLDAIKNVKHSLYLVMYGFTDEELLQAIVDQKKRGKEIKIILERQPYRREDQNKKVFTKLRKNHIAFQTRIFPFRLVHQKTLLIDDKTAIVMTFNFTKSAFKNKVRNFGLIVEDTKRVKAIKSIFLADWQRMPAYIDKNVITGTHSRDKLIRVLQTANKSIEIYAQTVSDYYVTLEFAKIAARGVKVTIITSKLPTARLLKHLTNAGVKIHVDDQLYIHAKTFLIDEKIAIVGSINLTKPSFEDNRELAIVSKDANVAKQLHAIFQQDLSAQPDDDLPEATALNDSLMQIYEAVKNYFSDSYRKLAKRAFS